MQAAIMTPSQTREAESNAAIEREAGAAAISLVEEADIFRIHLAKQITDDWRKNRDNRLRVDQEMLTCLRERKGEYDPDELALIQSQGGSDIFIKTATGKIRAGIAHIKSVMLPAGERAHGIEPTANPDIPPFMEKRILDRIAQNPNMVDDQGQPVPLDAQPKILMDMIRREIRSWSAAACERMERKINDQLDEGNWLRAMSDFIDDFCTYPAAFMRGPYMSYEPSLKYELQETGEYKEVSGFVAKWKFRTINPMDAYPAPGVDSCQKGSFIERLRMSKKELYRMRKMPGYSEEAIKNVMREVEGNTLENWLWTDTARKQIANHNYFWNKTTTDFDGLHWFGSAQGLDLLQWGMDPKLVPDPLDYYEVDAILVGKEVVRAAINPDPKYRRSVHSSCYERIPGNVFGNSVSMLMRSTGRMINATARALQNNQAHASGFQVEVNHRRLSPETKAHTHFPFKVWQTEESEQATNGAPAVRFFQPSSNAGELMGTISYFLNIADTDTGIPSVLQGGQGSTDGADGTAKGRGYLLSSAAKLLRSSIGNVDEDVVVPIIQIMYDNNMRYEDDPSIKADASVVARGANQMLQRETARQDHMAVLEITNNPMDQQIIGVRGRAHLLKKTLNTFENIDGNHVIPDGEEFDQLITSIENQEPPPDPMMIKIEADERVAMSKLDVESQKIALQERLKAEEIAAQRIIKTMELSTKEKISADDMQKTIQNEIVKLRATRMAERERVQMDLKMAKLKAESEARMKVADLKEQRKQRAEQGNADDMKAGVTDKEIAGIVAATVTPLFENFRTEIGGTIDSIAAAIQTDNVTGQPINVTVNMPSANKSMTFTKDPITGAMSGQVVAE